MTLIRFLLGAARRKMLIIPLAGLISGLTGAAFIALITTALSQPTAPSSLLILGVVSLGFGKVSTELLSTWFLVKIAQETLLDVGIGLCRKTLAAPLALLEEAGMHRILTALTDDVLVLGAAIQAIPSLAANIAVVVGCGIYLAWLSLQGFVAIMAVIVAGAALYKVIHASAFRSIFLAREGRDRLMGYFRALTQGIKELKMHRSRKEAFLVEKIEATAREVKQQNLTATSKYMLVDAWSKGLFYLLAGVMLFYFPRVNPDSSRVLTGFMFAALYMMAPVWGIIGSLPTLARGQVSLQKIQELGISLTSDAGREPFSAAGFTVLESPDLELKGVEFRYQSSDTNDRRFSFGPMDLSLRPGEVVFLVGGNGSGKSTLVKLLAGLYSPQAGEIRLGGQLISEENMEWYREHFSVVFSDFYLFESLLGVLHPDLDNLSNQYLTKLELDDKVTVSNGVFSTTALSQGQRKRLALLTALIEDRPIYVFDEWAAEQDPQYKDVFYLRLLPELRARGKAVVVVTHDDRYFDTGDRVIKLEDGRPTLQTTA